MNTITINIVIMESWSRALVVFPFVGWVGGGGGGGGGTPIMRNARACLKGQSAPDNNNNKTNKHYVLHKTPQLLALILSGTSSFN